MRDDRQGWAGRRGRDEAEDGLVQLAGVEESGVEVVRSEERAEVGVERVAHTRVRLVKRVVVERRTIELRREELHVEELPADGVDLAAAGDALTLGRGQPLEIVLRQEEAVVSTRLVPVERVRVWVERVGGDEQVSFELRHEEVEVDPPA